jgi:hypothetical protein
MSRRVITVRRPQQKAVVQTVPSDATTWSGQAPTLPFDPTPTLSRADSSARPPGGSDGWPPATEPALVPPFLLVGVM